MVNKQARFRSQKWEVIAPLGMASPTKDTQLRFCETRMHMSKDFLIAKAVASGTFLAHCHGTTPIWNIGLVSPVQLHKQDVNRVITG